MASHEPQSRQHRPSTNDSYDHGNNSGTPARLRSIIKPSKPPKPVLSADQTPVAFAHSDRHQNTRDPKKVAFPDDILDKLDHASLQQIGKDLVHVVGRPEFQNGNGSNQNPLGKKHVKDAASTDRHDYPYERQPSSHTRQPFSQDTQNAIPGKDNPSSENIVDEQVETKAFDVVYDPSRSAKDITIRLAMPVEEDLGPDLEEFCRLRRLGQFKDARNLYRARLERHSTTPYIVLHYAEMLVVSGDYKSFHELTYPQVGRSTGQESLADIKLRTNFELLRLLSRPSISGYTRESIFIVQEALESLKEEQEFGSTEIQLYALCLQVLNYLRNSHHWNIICQTTEDAKRIFDWKGLYYQLLGEDRIWDFRDLVVTTVSLFGWEETVSMLFDSTPSHEIPELIHHDWLQSCDDEATILGLLDIFTSLALESSARDNTRPAVLGALIKHARVLAEYVQRCGPDAVTTRPFIQWILAKTVAELRMEPGFQHVGLDRWDGILINQGESVHLPVFVPLNPSEKPSWMMFLTTSNATQRSAAKVAYRAALHTDDLYLQAMALKLLSSQLEDPREPLRTLSLLQIGMQGDIDGFLNTSLSRYLLVENLSDARSLVQELSDLDSLSRGESLLYSGVNPCLLWARDVILGHLLAAISGQKRTRTREWERNVRIYGSKLPEDIRCFIKDRFDVPVPPVTTAPARLSNIIGDQSHQPHDGPSNPMTRDRDVRSHLSEADRGYGNRLSKQPHVRTDRDLRPDSQDMPNRPQLLVDSGPFTDEGHPPSPDDDEHSSISTHPDLHTAQSPGYLSGRIPELSRPFRLESSSKFSVDRTDNQPHRRRSRRRSSRSTDSSSESSVDRTDSQRLRYSDTASRCSSITLPSNFDPTNATIHYEESESGNTARNSNNRDDNGWDDRYTYHEEGGLSLEVKVLHRGVDPSKEQKVRTEIKGIMENLSGKSFQDEREKRGRTQEAEPPYADDKWMQGREIERNTESQYAPRNRQLVARRNKSGNHSPSSKTAKTHPSPSSRGFSPGRQPSPSRPEVVDRWLELEEKRKENEQKMRQLREERASIEARLKAVVVEEEVLTVEEEKGHRVPTMDPSKGMRTGTGNTSSEQRADSLAEKHTTTGTPTEKVTVPVPSPDLSGHFSTTTAPGDSPQPPPPPSPLSLSPKDDQQTPSAVSGEEGEAFNSNVENSSFSTAHLSSHTADTKASASRVSARPKALDRRGSGGMGASVCSDEEYLEDDGDMTNLPPSSTAMTRVSVPEYGMTKDPTEENCRLTTEEARRRENLGDETLDRS